MILIRPLRDEMLVLDSLQLTPFSVELMGVEPKQRQAKQRELKRCHLRTKRNQTTKTLILSAIPSQSVQTRARTPQYQYDGGKKDQQRF
mmetsp:Transcript_9597/g.26108  ORF Transcript_9597/g.26108 Transcript_9597/m.26108 type:complete len:89 (-) Transcript_9597:1255-1521(-)